MGRSGVFVLKTLRGEEMRLGGLLERAEGSVRGRNWGQLLGILSEDFRLVLVPLMAELIVAQLALVIS